MIFATLGTHEQGFDRLVKELDRLKQSGAIGEELLIQGSVGKHEPRYCIHKNMLPYQELCDTISKSRIIITHGGPGSILLCLQYGKIPVTVPRQRMFGEHVDDHQVRFVKLLERADKVIAVYDIGQLESAILRYDEIAKTLKPSINDKCNRQALIDKLIDFCSRA